MPLTDPTDPSKVEHAKFGHFLTVGQRLGPGFFSDMSLLKPDKSVDISGRSASLVEPAAGYRYHLSSYVEADDAESTAFAQNVRTFTFNDPEGKDRQAKIYFYGNYGAYVDTKWASRSKYYYRNLSETITDVWLHDLTTGELVNIGHLDLKSEDGYGYVQDGCRDVAFQVEATLKNGHQYELYPRVWAHTKGAVYHRANVGVLVTNTYIVIE